jgi:hypothetical protein
MRTEIEPKLRVPVKLVDNTMDNKDPRGDRSSRDSIRECRILCATNRRCNSYSAKKISSEDLLIIIIIIKDIID